MDQEPNGPSPRVRYLEENLAAADLALSEEQLRRLAESVPAHAVAGQRYDPGGMANLER
jgi:hypothetical protein